MDQEPHDSPPSKPKPPPARKPSGTDDELAPRGPSVGPWLIIGVLFLVFIVWTWQQNPENYGTRVKYSFFIEQLSKDNIKEVKFHGQVLTGKWAETPKNPKQDGGKLSEEFNLILPVTAVEDPWLSQELRTKVIDTDADKSEPGMGIQLLFWMIGPILIIGFFWYMMRRSSDPMGSGVLGNFARSPAKRFQATEERTTFDDVAAMENAKRELQEVVEFLKNPAKFQRLGAEIPKGVLLMGQPGTGKTLLARATAGEADVPFYAINGSEFIQMFVGVGASRVRDLFRTAKEHSPCILFIDEIDAVGRMRGAGLGGGHDEREQTLNQILSEMDGFQQNEAVIVLAATNRPDVLDSALLRPGRFDRHITIDLPTKEGRLAILKVHCRKVPLGDDVDLDSVAKSTIGFSGAELKNLVNESALHATRTEKQAVEMDDFEMARDRVLMGAPREEILNEHEREMTAYHEAGHALLAWLLPGVDNVHKVTIIPRGRALGVTQLLPDEERYHIGERRLHEQLVMVLGGRAAEKVVFDEYSAGAEDDLKRGTKLVRRMVGHWGMSDVIGPVAFRHGEDHPFLGKEIHESREYSEETAHVIDQEVQRILTNASDRAFKMLHDKRDQLDELAKSLLEKETLGQDDLTEIIGEKVVAGNGRT